MYIFPSKYNLSINYRVLERISYVWPRMPIKIVATIKKKYFSYLRSELFKILISASMATNTMVKTVIKAMEMVISLYW